MAHVEIGKKVLEKVERRRSVEEKKRQKKEGEFRYNYHTYLYGSVYLCSTSYILLSSIETSDCFNYMLALGKIKID